MSERYITTDTELTSVADAIRSKGGTSDKLAYPDGFVDAIGAIETGSSEDFPPRDTSTDWQAEDFQGVYFTLDGSKAAGHPLRKIYLELGATKKNRGQLHHRNGSNGRHYVYRQRDLYRVVE